MSKKLIAIASAAALALTALVGIVPASATTAGAGPTGSGTSAAPYLVPVPEDNEIDVGDVATFTVTSAAGKTVSATSTGTVLLLDELTNATNGVSSATGKSTYSVSTGLATQVVIYAYSTSTTAGTVSVSDGLGNTSVFYVKGVAGNPYNVAVTVPSSVGVGGTATATAVVTDVFGNKISGTGTQVLDDVASGYDLVGDVLGGDSSVGNSGDFAWSTTKKAWTLTINGRSAVAGPVSLSVVLTTVVPVDGLADPKDTFFLVMNSTNLETVVAALTAEVAALKADYNALAAKWNKKVKKAKNKVALK